GPGFLFASGTTVAGTKPICCTGASFGSGRNNRRHRSSNERETPYRRAVAATWRGVCRLSRTILSFSSSDQRRRRPVSTTSSRSTWALRLSLSIRTVLSAAPQSARRLSAEAYEQNVGQLKASLDQATAAAERINAQLKLAQENYDRQA